MFNWLIKLAWTLLQEYIQDNSVSFRRFCSRSQWIEQVTDQNKRLSFDNLQNCIIHCQTGRSMFRNTRSREEYELRSLRKVQSIWHISFPSKGVLRIKLYKIIQTNDLIERNRSLTFRVFADERIPLGIVVVRKFHFIWLLVIGNWIFEKRSSCELRRSMTESKFVIDSRKQLKRRLINRTYNYFKSSFRNEFNLTSRNRYLTVIRVWDNCRTNCACSANIIRQFNSIFSFLDI